MRVPLALGLLVLSTPLAAAEEGVESSEQRRIEAEGAYDRGSEAYRDERFGEAARWYERADALIEADAALIQALRAYRRAGDLHRAATVAEALKMRRGRRHRRHTERVLRLVPQHGFRLEVRCDAPCELRVNGSEMRPVAWLDANATHVLVARFEHGERQAEVSAAAGERITLPLRAPEPPSPPSPAAVAEPERASPHQEPTVFRFPRPVAYAAISATLGLVAMTLWSGIDTRSAANDLAANPSLARFDEGPRLERRTNVLLGVTLGATAATGAIVGLTRWRERPEDSEGLAVRMGASPDGAVAVLRGRWR